MVVCDILQLTHLGRLLKRLSIFLFLGHDERILEEPDDDVEKVTLN